MHNYFYLRGAAFRVLKFDRSSTPKNRIPYFFQLVVRFAIGEETAGKIRWHVACEHLGMTQSTSPSNDEFEAVDQFVRSALEDGSDPAKLSAALTVVAVRMGLDLAPNAGSAFAVVFRAASEAAQSWAAKARQQEESDLERHSFKTATTIH